MSIVALSLLACGTGATADSGPVADYQLHLTPLVPLDQNPLESVDRIDLLLDSGVGDPLRVTLDAPASGSSAEATDLPALEGTRVIVEGYSGGELVAWGRSAPLTAQNGEVEATVFVSSPETLGQLGGLAAPGAYGAGVTLGSGRFVYMGGVTNKGGAAVYGVDTVSLLDLDAPTEGLAFAEVGTMPEYLDAEGDTQTRRTHFTATPLTAGDAGQVLIVGGSPTLPYGNSTQITSDVRLFDPETLTFGDALPSKDQLATTRAGHVAIANQQGGVLVWGGFSRASSGSISLQRGGELYDPVARGFDTVEGTTGAIGVAVGDLAEDGSLVAGGVDLTDDRPSLWYVSDACVIISLRGDSSTCSGMEAVAAQAMVGLSDGDVMSFGGVQPNGSLDQTASTAAVKTVWRYRKASGTWDEVGKMELARAGHTAVRLDDQFVLLAGGSTTWGPFVTDDTALSCVEVYDTVNNTSTMVGTCTAEDVAGGMPSRALAPTAWFDPDLGVLLAGGLDGVNDAVSTASFYPIAR